MLTDDSSNKLNADELEKVSGGNIYDDTKKSIEDARNKFSTGEIVDSSQLVEGALYFFEEDDCWVLGVFRGILSSEDRWKSNYMWGANFIKIDPKGDNYGGIFGYHERESNTFYLELPDVTVYKFNWHMF